MKNEELEAIRKRAEAATSGPWELDDKVVTVMADGIMYDITSKVYSGADAEFIANARQDVPALLAQVERLTKTLNYINELSEEFFTEVSEDSNSVSIPDSEWHKQTMQEIFVVSYEAVNEND